MVRTKKQGARSRQPSLVHGAAISADQVRYLELLVEDVECTVESTLATSQAIADRICHYTDVWYNHIIRTVPKTRYQLQTCQWPQRRFQALLAHRL